MTSTSTTPPPEFNGPGWQAVIEDQQALSGESVADMITRVAGFLDARWVVISEIDPLLPPLYYEGHWQSWSVDDVIPRVRKYAQLDWGNFAFYPSRKAAHAAMCLAGSVQCRTSTFNAVWVSSADVLLRCVDDFYFYFYGRSPAIFQWILEEFHPSERKEAMIFELDYPR